MENWILADGSKLALATHTPEDWAELTRMQLLTLGCSAAYAERRAELIRSARSGLGQVSGSGGGNS